MCNNGMKGVVGIAIQCEERPSSVLRPRPEYHYCACSMHLPCFKSMHVCIKSTALLGKCLVGRLTGLTLVRLLLQVESI